MQRFLTLAMLALLGGTATTAALAQPAVTTQYIPSRAYAAVIGRPEAILQKEALDLLPREIFSAAGLQTLGLDPTKIEQITGIIATDGALTDPPQAGMIVRFTAPYALGGNLAAQYDADADGKTLRPRDPSLPVLYKMSDTVLLGGTTDLVQEMAQARPADSALLRMITAQPPRSDITVYAALEMIQPQLQALVQDAPPLPGPFQPLLELPDHLKSLMMIANVKAMNEIQLGVQLTGYNAASTDRLAEILTGSMAIGKEMAVNQAKMDLDPADPIQNATAAYVDRVADAIEKSLQPQRRGDSLVVMMNNSAAVAPGVMVALLLPAVQAAREAARRSQSSNNLKQIVLAMHNYLDSHKAFPAAAIYSADGKPLLSWRVAMLPYLEENALYEQFHLDEPWDSEHNIKLLDQMPETYRNPNLELTTKTNYLAVTGAGAVFEGTKGRSIQEITDGTSTTILVVEANADQAVEWTKPADYTIDPENSMQNLGDLRDGGFLAAFADGSVHFLQQTIDRKMLGRLLTRNDGWPTQVP
ncbi:DUF1559 domain-containing protein [Lignipirellula cremea]|uniref:DUF1559 domain-containing protein n=1 Tax=Lignipirellula cremea TaxID=2528010 RepID=A0A518DNQ8_9BACT|nr:DUF1559 domain-containing protein [Lignipirellula cremea]QDU93474.1 hypothetical protein Pla8534_12540 [Lignipirellula cremea]